MDRIWMVTLVAIALLGCTPKTPAASKPEVSVEPATPPAAMPGKVSEVVKAVRILAGVKFDEKLDASGKLAGLTIIARDNSIQTLTCGCSGACGPSAADPCKLTKQEPTGSTTYQCSGSCIGSEQLPCGSCGMVPSGDILSPHDFVRVLGVEIVGNDQPAVERDPERPTP